MDARTAPSGHGSEPPPAEPVEGSRLMQTPSQAHVHQHQPWAAVLPLVAWEAVRPADLDQPVAAGFASMMRPRSEADWAVSMKGEPLPLQVAGQRQWRLHELTTLQQSAASA